MGYDSKNTEFGTKRTVVGAHYGLKDWLAQRITAVILEIGRASCRERV